MNRILAWSRLLSRRPYLSVAVVVGVVLVVWFFFGRNSNKELQTLTVARSDFAPTVSIAGSVVAAKEVDLGFAQSGRVTGVYASVGQHVTQGTLLANTENGDLRAELQSARAKLAAAQEGTRPEEVAIAKTTFESDRAEVENALNNAYRSADDAARAKTADLFDDPRTDPTLTFITESKTGKQAAESGRLAIENRLRRWEQARATPPSNAAEAVTEAQQILKEIASFLTAVSTALNSATTDAIVSQSDIDSYKSNIATARANINSAQTTLTSAYASYSESEKNLALKQAGSRPSDIAIEQAAVDAAQAALNKTIITAPFSGLITVMDAKVGEIVSPNTPELSMISTGTFQIETYIPEVLIADVVVGNSAKVSLDAYGPEVVFEARIVAIDPAETVKDGVSTYKTTLQFSKEDPRIRAGMTANIIITTQTRPSTIVIPQGALITRSGTKYVQVLSGKNVVEREVTTGLSSLGEIEITQGVAEGDAVVLNPQQ